MRKILFLTTSPTAGGNGDALISTAMEAAEKAGAQTELVNIREKKINFCKACYGCRETGVCVQKDDFQANEVIAQGMENSEFYSAVVEVLTKSLSDVQYDTMTAAKEAGAANDVLAKSMNAVIVANAALRADNERLTRRINKLEKSISQGFDKIMDSLDEMSSQPAHMRKSMRAVNVHDKDFGASLDGVQTAGGFDSLSKSQVMTILNSELYGGNPNVQATDIISYESGAPLRPDLQALVASKVK